MSRATRITDNYALLNNLHRLMWDASDAVMAVYHADMESFEEWCASYDVDPLRLTRQRFVTT